MSVFSPTEIKRRWEALWAAAPAVDAIVTSSFHNSYYLSGFPMHPWGRYAITVLFRETEPALIVPELEADAAAEESPIRDRRIYNDDRGPSLSAAADLLIKLLRRRKTRSVGVDLDCFPAALYQHISSAVTANVVDIGETIDDVRLISSPEELALIREAIRIADFGMERVVATVRPGASEGALTNDVSHEMAGEAPTGIDCSTICVIQQGERQSSRCHRPSTDIPIADAQTIQIWCEAYVWHYCGNNERCLILGDAPARVARACQVALEAFEAACERVRPGTTFAEAHAAARDVLAQAGYTKIPTGSGLVRSVVSEWGGRIEAGNLRRHNQREFRPGMAVSVEPWAVIPQVGAPHLATTLLVTSNGHEVLNTFPSTVPHL